MDKVDEVKYNYVIVLNYGTYLVTFHHWHYAQWHFEVAANGCFADFVIPHARHTWSACYCGLLTFTKMALK